VPSTPADAYSLLRDSIECDDPVIFLEPKRRYWMKGEIDRQVRTAPIGQALVVRPGTTVTVVTYGGLVGTALEAATVAIEQHGWDLEIIDLRSLVPLDFDTIAASVVRTGRCVVLHEGARTLGMGAEIAARVQEELFWNLEAPVLRATGFDTPYPPARLEGSWLPGVDRLLDCVERSLGYDHA
jgi:pyruvate dehydrogenase E1 component beta subunit